MPLDQDISLETRVIGAPDVSAPLLWSTKTGNRMRLFQNRQSGEAVRHPAWREDRGFPTAPDSVASTVEAARYIREGLRVYVARTVEGEYFAGFLVGGYPADWPDNADLRALFTGPGGVRFFTGGMYLEPPDQTRPFQIESDTPAHAHGGVFDTVEDPTIEPPPAATKTYPYASPDVAAKVDRIAMDLGMDYTAERFPDAQVRRMPHNNPGYDILVSRGGQTVRYVEVKGTTTALPRFYLSENERRFSADNSELYTLVVFFEIDLEAETGRHVDRDGALELDDVDLRVIQWQGRLGA